MKFLMNLPARLAERAFWLSMAVAIVLPGQLVAQVQLEQATYIGGSDFDRAQGCAIDNNGFIYIAGNTRSTNLPTTPGVVQQSSGGDYDAFVAKFSPDLKQLIALTYWGGGSEDRGYGVNVDAAGNIYLSGITKSPALFTSPGAFDRTFEGTVDVFLTKFSPDLKTVLFSTLLGSSSPSTLDSDWTRGGIQLDSQNNIYLPGNTAGSDFPTTSGAFATTFAGGVHDAFITKIKSDGSGLLWSTFAGGSTGAESFYGNLILHSDGSVFTGGKTNSTDFPVTPGAYDSSLDGSGYQWWDGEGVVARFKADGSGLLYSTYLWGPVSGNDGLAVDANGRAHVNTNVTQSQAVNVPVSAGAAQTSFGGVRDMAIAILAADGSGVERASFLGGTGDEEGSGIELDSAGNIYVGGNTRSTDFPIKGGSSVAQPASAGGRDAFFSVLDQQLVLLYSTYLGGPGDDRTRCIAYGPNEKILISGDTDGGFPGVVGGYDALHNGSRDGFIALFSGVLAGGGGGTLVPDISVTDPVAPIDDLSLDFGDVDEGGLSSKVITVANVGNSDLTITGQVGQGDSLAVPFAIQNDTCSLQTLAPGAICTIKVDFSPVAQQLFNDSFDIPSDDPDEAIVIVSLSGTGVPASGGGTLVPDISVTDPVAPIDDLGLGYGDVDVGGLSSKVITVANVGNADLTIGQAGQANPLAVPFAIQNDTCSLQTLAPGAICTIKVDFSPAAQQLFNDSFDIPSDDPDEAIVIVSLSGTGVPVSGGGTLVPDISVADPVAPFDDLNVGYGDVDEGGLSSKVITVVNSGTSDLTIGHVGQANPLAAPFTIQNDTCSLQMLAPGAICTIKVDFSPAAQQLFNDSFDIPSDDPDEAIVIVSLSGTGVPAGGGGVMMPDIVVTDPVTPFDDLGMGFGDVDEGGFSSKVITVANIGNTDLTIGQVGQANPLAAPFTIRNDTCSLRILLPGDICTIKIRFSPLAQKNFNDKFDIPSDDPDEAIVIVSLSGTGVPVSGGGGGTQTVTVASGGGGGGGGCSLATQNSDSRQAGAWGLLLLFIAGLAGRRGLHRTGCG